MSSIKLSLSPPGLFESGVGQLGSSRYGVRIDSLAVGRVDVDP